MALWYIDPTTASESDAYDGGYGSGKLRDRYSDVSGLAAGDSIYFKSGTTHPGRCTLTTTGTSAAWITVGKYGGSARAIIDAQGGSGGTACFLLNAVSYVRVSGLHGINNTASAGAAVTALRSSHIEITDCEGSDNQMGITARQDQAATVTDILIRDNYVHDNIFAGIYVEAGTIAGAVIGDVDIEGNIVECNGFAGGLTTYSTGGIFVKSTYRSAIDATRCPYGVRTKNNVVRGNSGYGIAYSPVLAGGRGSYIENNEVTGQSPLMDIDTHCIWVGGSVAVRVFGNHVHHNFGLLNGSHGSGVGIFIDQYDDGSVGTANSVIANKIHDQWQGATNANIPSAGIYFFHSAGGHASGNVVYRCRQGIVVLGESSGNNTTDTIVSCNTIDEISEAGLVAANSADGTTFNNNIVRGAQWGFFVETGGNAATNVAETKNVVHDCGADLVNGTWASKSAGSLDVGDLTGDPLLDSSYRPIPESSPGAGDGSPCIGAATYLKSARHMGGKRMSPVSPTIGAHGYYAAREIATDRTKYGPFSPREDYSVLQGDGTTYTASVGAKTRRHDYGGSLPIVRHDGATGIEFAQHSGVTNSARTIEDTYPTGEAGHYERLGPKWRIAYTTGEALTAGTARCQLLSYPLPPGRMTFDMNVQFGDSTDNWTLTTNGTSPALFWQLKPNAGPQPAFQLNVDTDSTNAAKLEIYFNYKELSFTGSVTRLVTVRGLDRHVPINVAVDGLFTFGTEGWVELRVNGEVEYRRDNFKTLQTDTDTYYHMHWGLYMWNDTNPATAPTRVTWWARNNVLVPQDVVRDIATDRPVRLMVAT